VTLPLDSHDLAADAVRARLDSAKRQGAWLWPDIPVAEWRRALGSIETVARAVLTGTGLRELEGDPAAVGLACYTSGMGPLLGWWHAHGRVGAGDKIGALLALHFAHNRLRSREMRQAASNLIEALEPRGVPVVVLKGADTAQRYFPLPETRPASDTDLLVAPDEAVEAEQVLNLAGYRLLKRSLRESDWRRSDVGDEAQSLMFVHAKDPWSIDLHVSLNVRPAAGLGLIQLDKVQPMESAGECPYFTRRGLRQPLLLIHLAAHASTGRHNLSLLRLVELQLVIREDEASRNLYWDHFLDLCRQVRALGAVFPALKLTEDLVPSTIPEHVLRDCAAAAPARVRAIVSTLSPAIAQRVTGTSIREHFMWAHGAVPVIRQLAADSLPGRSWQDIRGAYVRRFWQVSRGSISR
jgi:hypothetical protein